jgi:hypothetical protein
MDEVVNMIRVLANLVRQGRYQVSGDESVQIAKTLADAMSLALSLEQTDKGIEEEEETEGGF